MTLSPIAQRRVAQFRRNRRAWWSLWLFLALFAVSCCANFIANDRPIVLSYGHHFYFPVFKSYPETAFGGTFQTEADYRDPYVQKLIDAKGWMLWPPVRYSYRTINYDLQGPAPSPPSAENWLGTDDQGRDVFARLLYGYRISILFGLTLTILSSAVGIAVGALEGYFGGLFDLLSQRFIEIWGGMPVFFLLIIMSSVITPGFFS
ncbi:MAG: ABC transporter permease, partial [Alphaproteobacteria bacterium]|nr:ABC transporter permease [Alphaproteobacteria bacterium]